MFFWSFTTSNRNKDHKNRQTSNTMRLTLIPSLTLGVSRAFPLSFRFFCFAGSTMAELATRSSSFVAGTETNAHRPVFASPVRDSTRKGTLFGSSTSGTCAAGTNVIGRLLSLFGQRQGTKLWRRALCRGQPALVLRKPLLVPSHEPWRRQPALALLSSKRKPPHEPWSRQPALALLPKRNPPLVYILVRKQALSRSLPLS